MVVEAAKSSRAAVTLRAKSRAEKRCGVCDCPLLAQIKRHDTIIHTINTIILLLALLLALLLLLLLPLLLQKSPQLAIPSTLTRQASIANK